MSGIKRADAAPTTYQSHLAELLSQYTDALIAGTADLEIFLAEQAHEPYECAEELRPLLETSENVFRLGKTMLHIAKKDVAAAKTRCAIKLGLPLVDAEKLAFCRTCEYWLMMSSACLIQTMTSRVPARAAAPRGKRGRHDRLVESTALVAQATAFVLGHSLADARGEPNGRQSVVGSRKRDA